MAAPRRIESKSAIESSPVDPRQANISVSEQAGIASVSDQAEIAALAYQFWLDRGCPVGSPEVDWLRAERALAEDKTFGTAA